MNRNVGYLIGAFVLIIIGVLLLLQNLGIFVDVGVWLIALGFVAGGVAFIANFAVAPSERWWSIIPGMVLVALGVLIAFGQYLGAWAASLILGAIAIAFWIVYFTQRDFWWALIPAGVLTTLTLIIPLQPLLGDLGFPGAFFIGIGLTFGLVFLLPTKENTRWAIWPAAVTLLMGIIFTISSVALAWLWAVALIAAGLYLIVRAIFVKEKPSAVTTSSAAPAATEPAQESGQAER